MIRPWARSQRRVIACRRSRSTRSSGISGKARPSEFLVVPGSSRTKPAARSTCGQRSGRTSDRLRHPVMNMNRTASAKSGERCRQMAAICFASAKPCRALCSGKSRMRGIARIVSLSRGKDRSWRADEATTAIALSIGRRRTAEIISFCPGGSSPGHARNSGELGTPSVARYLRPFENQVERITPRPIAPADVTKILGGNA